MQTEPYFKRKGFVRLAFLALLAVEEKKNDKKEKSIKKWSSAKRQQGSGARESGVSKDRAKSGEAAKGEYLLLVRQPVSAKGGAGSNPDSGTPARSKAIFCHLTEAGRRPEWGGKRRSRASFGFGAPTMRAEGTEE